MKEDRPPVLKEQKIGRSAASRPAAGADVAGAPGRGVSSQCKNTVVRWVDQAVLGVTRPASKAAFY